MLGARAVKCVGDDGDRRVEPWVDLIAVLLEVADGGEPCSGGERAAVEVTHVSDRASRDHREDIARAAHCADRKTRPERFPQDGEVRRDLKQFLRATKGDTESRDDLVEDQKGAGLSRQALYFFQVTGFRREAAPIDVDRLHDHCGNVVCKGRPERLYVIPFADGRPLGSEGILSACSRAITWHARNGNMHRVEPPVVVTAELDDPIAPSCRTGHSQGCLDRFRTRVAEDH